MKIKIVSFNTDKKTKLLMIFAIIIAVLIIIYNFFNICIRKGNVVTSEELNLEEIIAFNSQSEITVNSNKNSNVYDVREESNLETDEYHFLIDNELEININCDEIRISNLSMTNEFFSANEFLDEDNYMSLASILKIVRKVSKGEIEGKIKKITQDSNIVYEISIQDARISIIKVFVGDDKIQSIELYDNDQNEEYNVKVNSFEVKKSL